MEAKESALKYYQRYTVAEWEHWQDRWELINGFPYAMSPMPTSFHQNINGKILHQLYNLLDDCNSCKVYLPINWKVDNETVVHPDISVVCPGFEGTYLEYAPKIIFEILSPSTVLKDRNQKFDLYEAQQVEQYVIVNPESETAEIYFLENNKYKKVFENREGIFVFETECKIDFDFVKIW